MKKTRFLFLAILKNSLCGQKVELQNELSPESWPELFTLAETHQVLPLFYEAVYSLPEIQALPEQTRARLTQYVKQQVLFQTIKTSEFLLLYQQLSAAGLRPLVVKGIICRNLYPKPDHRPSGDEDMLISPEQFARCQEALVSLGMQSMDPDRDMDMAYEMPYGRPGSPLHIELHKHLFAPESDAVGDFNRFFDGVFERASAEEIQGTMIYTMAPTDHLFYLICHAFKHFVHSGFGIRQVCDIVMYANAYGSQIHWLKVLENCREINAQLFAAAIFKMGEKYLGFDPDKACFPVQWQSIKVDETAMLQDLLCGGLYGDANMSRKHSSNITLDAVTAHKQGKRTGNTVLSALLPSAKKLESRYPYLRKHPYLLPVAWIDRIWKYRKEISKTENNSASETVKIGKQRIELLKQYGIIK